MVDAQATLDTLRNIKNTIIGNPTAKRKLAADGTVALVLEWINASEHVTEPIFEQIRIEAAHIIAAQAYGPPEALVAVLEAQAPQALVNALKEARHLDVPRLIIALTRALRSVISAAADTIGPVRWHFQRDSHPARLEARLVLEDTFSPDALAVILPYLAHPESDVRRNVAVMIARGLVVDDHRTRVFEYDARAAMWDLVKMLSGDVRNQSAAAYALAEIARDNEPAARFLSDRMPVGAMDRSADRTVERGRPTVRIPGPGAEPGSLLSMTRPESGSLLSLTRPDSTRPGHSPERNTETIRVLDLICKFLPSRNGDLREAACLCLSTTIRQLRPPLRESAHAMVMWLNLAIEEFAPAPESTPQPPQDPAASADPTGASGDGKAADTASNPKMAWMQKCRWRPNEIGGGEAARRVVGACYILADFVNDREDLLSYVVHTGTLQRAVRALLILPPVPIPPGKPSPALSGRWGPGTTSAPSSGLPAPIPIPAPTNRINAPSGLARTRRASSVQIGFTSTPSGATLASIVGPGPVVRPGPTSPARASLPSALHIAAPVPSTSSPVPPPIVPAATATPGSPPSPVVQRRLSFAELARRASESGGDGFARRTPSRVRRTSNAGTGSAATGTATGSTESPSAGGGASSSGADAAMTDVSRPGDAMVVDSAGQNTNAPTEDVTMRPAESASAPAPANPQDVVMGTAVTSVPATPALAAPAPTPRRRRKPPPDPALGPYTFPTSTPTPTSTPAPLAPLPPAPESTLRSALLILLASFTMQSDEHRRALVEVGALGGVFPPGRRLGAGGVIVPGSGTLKPGEVEGVTGVLGALGSPDPEVRWAAVMVARSIARSTSVLRTGLYDSGIGRAIFDMLMHRESDRRVLVAVLRVCCNLLNQYSPMREMFIRDGGMQKLAELCDAEEPTIRMLSLWAFKNSLFRATAEEKRTSMATLGWARLERILNEPPGELLEQALGVIRNLSASEPDAEYLITHLAPSKLLDATERTLGSDESSSSASLFALAHVAFIPSVRLLILARRRILEFICTSLGHAEVQVRGAAALCVAQMAGCVPRRVREMRDVGIDGRLKVLRGRETDEEVRENVNRALAVFELRDP